MLKNRKRLWLLGFLFAALWAGGKSFIQSGSFAWLMENRVSALWMLCVGTPVLALIMMLVCELLKRQKPKAGSGRTAIRWSGLLLLCWLPWYICLFPGTVSNDSISQLRMILGETPLSNANPIFQTGLVAFFKWLGKTPDLGVALYCICQALFLAWVLGQTLFEMQGSLSMWLVWLFFAFYALCPVFPVFAFCVGKDTNFAAAVLLIMLRVKQLTQTQENPKGLIVRLCVACIACVLLRNAGIYLVLLTMVLLLVWSLVKGRNALAPMCGLASAVLVFVLLTVVFLPAMHIAQAPKTEESSIPLQQVARAAVNGQLTEDQKQRIAGVLDAEAIKAVYQGELSDPVKDLWNKDASAEDVAAFRKVWQETLIHYPMTCVSATFHNSFAYVYPGYKSPIKASLLIGDQTTRTASVKGKYDYSINPLAARLKNLTEKLDRIWVYRLFTQAGLYGWITLLCVTCLMRKQTTAQLLTAVPALFVLLGCFASAVNGYLRYSIPVIAAAPLLIALLAEGERKRG